MSKDKMRGINITPYMLHGNKTWQLEVVNSGKKGGPGNYPSVDVPAKFGGNFKITIVDGDGITFSNDPIWVQAGTAKPTEPVIDPQITKIKGKNTPVLTFHDANSGPAMTLTYQLNFNNADPLDPIILNGGGGGAH